MFQSCKSEKQNFDRLTSNELICFQNNVIKSYGKKNKFTDLNLKLTNA